MVEPGEKAPSSPNVLKQKNSCSGEGCLQILQADDLVYDFVDLIFRIRPLEGEQRGIGGAVFSVQDEKNFYAVLVDFSKDTLSVVRVMNGEETVISDIMAKSQIVMAMTEFSATAPLSTYVQKFDHLRAASMPGILRRMEQSALAADYREVARRAQVLAERALAHRFNRPSHTIVDHFTYALVSDGDLMEGVAAEAASLPNRRPRGRPTR